jgi:hypothetical protein
MKKNDVQPGATYLVKVANNLVPVTITREHDQGGWEGQSVKTGKTIRIKSPQRLRKRIDVDWPPVAAIANEMAQEASDAGQRDTGERRATGGGPDGKPMSLLDAAAHLLGLGTGDPMRCKDIVDLAVARGLWTPGDGKTPANSLYAAIHREITTKGTESRFVKAEHGKFALVNKA